MSHGHQRYFRQRRNLLLNYTVEPEDVELLAEQHTAFNPRKVPGIVDDENDEHGFVDRLLGRWQDRPFGKF